MEHTVSLMVLIIFSYIHGSKCVSIGERLALVRELDEELSWKRNLDEALPDHIPLELTTSEGKVHMMLQRENVLEHVDVFLTTEGREEEVDIDRKNVGIYSDMDKHAVIKVHRKSADGKREYTGSLVHEGKHYELHPLGESSSDFSRIIARTLHSEVTDDADLQVHTLRQVEVTMPGDDSFEFENEPSKRKENEKIEEFFKSLGDRGSNQENGNQGQAGDIINPDRPKPDLSGSHPTTHNQGNLEEKMQELLSLLRNRKENQQNKEEDIDDFPDELQLQEEREHFEPDLHTRHRQKRNALAAMTDPDNDYVFTVAIFVDPTIYDYWTKEQGLSDAAASKEIAYYVSHQFNGMSMIFRRITNAIHGFTVIPWLDHIRIFKAAEDIVFLKEARTSGGNHFNGMKMADLLAAYRKNNPKYSWVLIGHIIYLTRADLYVETSFSPVGVSPKCSICDPKYGFSIVEDNGWFSYFAMAHEAGHNLGASHDGSENSCSPYDMNMMTPGDIKLNPQNVKNGFRFSLCSIKAMRACISGRKDAIGKTCMHITPCSTKEPLTDITTLPGDRYSYDRQCKLFVHPAAYYDKSCDVEPCLKLPCKLYGNCAHGHVEAKPVPGSSCGGKKVCMWGECVRKNMKSYYDLSCVKKGSIKLNPVPDNCPQEHKDCEYYAKNMPYAFFYDPKFREFCPTSTQKYGLHFDFARPCWAKKLDDYSCPYSESLTINYKQIGDGRVDCPSGTDESDTAVNNFCIKIPFCFSDDHFHKPDDFAKCISSEEACKSSKYAALCNLIKTHHLD